jgi:hypothetical protein
MKSLIMAVTIAVTNQKGGNYEEEKEKTLYGMDRTVVPIWDTGFGGAHIYALRRL